MSTGGRSRSLNCLPDCEYRIAYCLVYTNAPCSFLIDTWQYFLHRAVHMNKFLYKTLHSWHHRLYVPYSYAALYNNPIEGFILDSCSVVIAERFTGMSIRQATLLFTIATFKTVDDHCGYSLPFDPLRLFTSNNSDYHDIHHQVHTLHKLILVRRVLNSTVARRDKVKLLNGFRVLGCPPRDSGDKRRDRGPKTTQGCRSKVFVTSATGPLQPQPQIPSHPTLSYLADIIWHIL